MTALETGIKLTHKPAVYTEAVLPWTFPFFWRSGLFNITSVLGVKVYRGSRGSQGGEGPSGNRGERRPVRDCGGKQSLTGWLGFDWQRDYERSRGVVAFVLVEGPVLGPGPGLLWAAVRPGQRPAWGSTGRSEERL